MNDLAILSEQDLLERAKAADFRADYLKTEEGQKEAMMAMLNEFAYLRAYGYRFEGDAKRKAVIWAEALSECISVYGYEKVSEAVRSFANSDLRDFRAFPMPSDIIAECKKLGRNPKAELARREQERIERELELKWRKECEREYTEEETKEAIEKIKRKFKGEAG